MKIQTNHKSMLFLAAITAALVAGFAAQSLAETVEIGDGDAFPTAACPGDKCQAVGRVTGYQIQIGTRKNPMMIAKNGRIVALTVALPTLTKKQIDSFDANLGGAAAVRVAVLRPKVRKGVRYRYALAGQSELLPLKKYFGSTPTFPLVRSLTARKGDVIGLTVDTWMPGFAVGLDKNNAWRSSRSAKSCDNVNDAAQHDARGSIRVYGCLYRTARLLYKATLITNPKTTSK